MGKEKKIELVDNKKLPHLKLAYLEGVIMENGEFISNGNCQFIKTEESKIYIDKE